jgi:hypothetical protein
MSEYHTYVLGKDDFTVGQDLKDIEIKTEAGADGTQYVIKAKCGLDTPFGRILELMEMGMEFKITLADGTKSKLQLVPIA